MYATNGVVWVGPGRTVCTFVWLFVCLNLKVLVLDVLDAVLYEVVISPSCVRFPKTLQWKRPLWGWSLLNVWNGRSGRTASMFACDVFEFEGFGLYYIKVFSAVWGHDLIFMRSSNTLQWQWQWQLNVVPHWIYYGTVSCWPRTNRKYVFMHVWVRSKVSLVFDAVWCHNLIFILRCLNALHTMAMTTVRLRSLNVWNVTILAAQTNSLYVYRSLLLLCVCLNLKMLLVFDVVWCRNLTLMRYFLYKYT